MIYVKNEQGVFNLLSNKRYLNIDNTTKIICYLKYQVELMQNECFKNCNYEIISTDMDNSLNDVFASVKAEPQNQIKQKKKTLFDIFKRK